jgi:hypothetical protein
MYALPMTPTQTREHIDLFDDPSWESKESRADAEAYERLVVSGLSPKTEWVFVGFSVGACVVGLVAFLLLSLTPPKKAAPRTATTLPPITLPIGRSSVEAFFDAQGGGGWAQGPFSSSAYNIVDMAGQIDMCQADILSTQGPTTVSAVTVACDSGNASTDVRQQAISLVVATVKQFVPMAVTWTMDTFKTSASGNYMKTFGDAKISLAIATPNSASVSLGILAKGF